MEKKILDTATELFKLYGLKSVSMDDIARRLGISKKTLYRHVTDKKTLVHETIVLFIDNDISKLDKLFDNNVINALDKMLQIHQHRKGMVKSIKPTLIYDLQKYYRDTWDYLQKHYFNFVRKQIRENIEEGQDQGVYRKEIDADIISRLMITKILHLNNEQLFPENAFSQETVHEQNIFYHLFGIVTNHGYGQLLEYLNKNKI